MLVAHVWLPAPSFKPPPSAPVTPAERRAAAKQNTHRTARQPLLSVANAPFAAAPSSPHTDRPLDLSPQAIRQAVQRHATPSLAQAAREQLGHEPVPAATRLGQHIAAGAVPDCLHNAAQGEAKSPAIGGLLALPLMAYAAMTGKCR